MISCFHSCLPLFGNLQSLIYGGVLTSHTSYRMSQDTRSTFPIRFSPGLLQWRRTYWDFRLKSASGIIHSTYFSALLLCFGFKFLVKILYCADF